MRYLITTQTRYGERVHTQVESNELLVKYLLDLFEKSNLKLVSVNANSDNFIAQPIEPGEIEPAESDMYK